MKRRLRCLCRSGKREEGLQRYLRPGALAQLRDSKISARSQRPSFQAAQIFLYRSPSPPSTETNQISVLDGFPCFARRAYAPRCPQRKKLVAAKSFFFLVSNPSSPVSDSSPDSIMDVFTADIIVSH